MGPRELVVLAVLERAIFDSEPSETIPAAQFRHLCTQNVEAHLKRRFGAAHVDRSQIAGVIAQLAREGALVLDESYWPTVSRTKPSTETSSSNADPRWNLLKDNIRLGGSLPFITTDDGFARYEALAAKLVAEERDKAAAAAPPPSPPPRAEAALHPVRLSRDERIRLSVFREFPTKTSAPLDLGIARVRDKVREAFKSAGEKTLPEDAEIAQVLVSALRKRWVEIDRSHLLMYGGMPGAKVPFNPDEREWIEKMDWFFRHEKGEWGRVASWLSPDGRAELDRLEDKAAAEREPASPAEPTVFYSWQSDLPNNLNRGLIERAATSALAKLKETSRELELEPRLDQGVEGEAGAVAIDATIFAKIDKCSIFLADVSLVSADGAERPTPNPNVLLELGYAAGKIGWKRVVLVFNTAFGKVEQLPFDLRPRLVFGYSAPRDGPEDDRRASRETLAKKLEGQFRAIFDSIRAGERLKA